MDPQLTALTRQIGTLTAEVKNSRGDSAVLHQLLTELRDAFVEQSGSLAVVAAEAVANRHDVEELKKKAQSKSAESSYWKWRFESLKSRERDAGRRRHLRSSNWIPVS